MVTTTSTHPPSASVVLVCTSFYKSLCLCSVLDFPHQLLSYGTVTLSSVCLAENSQSSTVKQLSKNGRKLLKTVDLVDCFLTPFRTFDSVLFEQY